MVFKIADNFEAGGLIRRLLQTNIIHIPVRGAVLCWFSRALSSHKNFVSVDVFMYTVLRMSTFLFCTSTLIWKPEMTVCMICNC